MNYDNISKGLKDVPNPKNLACPSGLADDKAGDRDPKGGKSGKGKDKGKDGKGKGDKGKGKKGKDSKGDKGKGKDKDGKGKDKKGKDGISQVFRRPPRQLPQHPPSPSLRCRRTSS